MNVLGNTANPSTSVDICITDGFQLDSGLRIGDGDGVILTQSEAFVWRPWMAAGGGEVEAAGVVHGSGLRQKGLNETARTGGVVNQMGQFEVRDEGWGLFKALWPKPGIFLFASASTKTMLQTMTNSILIQTSSSSAQAQRYGH